MSAFKSPLEPGQIQALKDEHIDFSEIPELVETFWRAARPVESDRTEQISLRIRCLSGSSVRARATRPGSTVCSKTYVQVRH